MPQKLIVILGKIASPTKIPEFPKEECFSCGTCGCGAAALYLSRIREIYLSGKVHGPSIVICGNSMMLRCSAGSSAKSSYYHFVFVFAIAVMWGFVILRSCYQDPLAQDTGIRVGGDRVVDVPKKILLGPGRADRRCDHLSGHHMPVPDQA